MFLLLRKWVVAVLIGTYIHRVLVIDIACLVGRRHSNDIVHVLRNVY